MTSTLGADARIPLNPTPLRNVETRPSLASGAPCDGVSPGLAARPVDKDSIHSAPAAVYGDSDGVIRVENEQSSGDYSAATQMRLSFAQRKCKLFVHPWSPVEFRITL